MDRKTKVLLVAALLVGAGTPGCGFINKLQAKDNLNEGVRDFNKGRYPEARRRFERALELDPDNANAQLFYARALNALFDQNLTEELGLETLKAYESIIATSGDNYKAIDQALAFRAKVFEQLAGIEPTRAQEYKQNQREALLARANLPIADDKTKATVYYTIGQGYWAECYHGLSRKYQRVERGLVVQQAIPPEVADKMRALIIKSHEYLQKAIAIQPEYADAWIYERLVYLEEVKIEPNPAKKKELEAKSLDALEKYKKFHEKQQQSA